MTEPDVRDLLAELADSVEAPDLASTAWDRSVRRRRRRTTAGIGAVAAATAIAFGAVHLRADDVSTGVTTHPSPTTSQPSEPAGRTLDGFTVAVAPRWADEATLPIAGSPLPSSTIDLSAPNPSVVDEPLLSAVAAFAIRKVLGSTTRFDGIMLDGPNGELRHLDAARLQPIDIGDGNVASPFTAGSLSPDGTRLAFPQPTGVTMFTIPTGEWTSFPISVTRTDLVDLRWTSDGMIRLARTTLDPDTGRTTSDRVGSPLYQSGLKVQSWTGVEHTLGDLHARAAGYLDERSPAPGIDTFPPAIVAVGNGVRALLVIPDQQPRWKNCCTVAGWLDSSTVAYDATSSQNPLRPDQTTRVLAWNVATGDVRLVTTVTGSADMLFQGSYANLARDF
jgi:hypothetical protein